MQKLTIFDLISEEKQYLEVFAEFLRVEVAHGDAREDTLRTYRSHAHDFLRFLKKKGLQPSQVTYNIVNIYRKELVDRNLAHSTITLKLLAVRRFYDAAVSKGLLPINPAKGVRPPAKREAEKKKHLTAEEAELLFQEVRNEKGVKGLRDKAMIALMALEGLRSIEVVKANTEDLKGGSMLIHGKERDDYIYPRKDTLEAIKGYICARGFVVADKKGTPLFTALSNYTRGKRLSRDGIRSIVNDYLEKAGLKVEGISCHSLRHTCGALLYQATRDLKAVQHALRHRDIKGASLYSHIIHQSEARYTEEIHLGVD